MKKLLVLLLVLGLANVADATLSLEIRDGGSAVTEMVVGQNYLAVISSDATSSVAINGGLYGPTFTASDWALVTPSNPIDLDASGDAGIISWYAPYEGYEWTAFDASSAVMPNQDVGDWFTVDLSPTGTGSFQLDLYDYAVSSSVPILGVSVPIVPEPATIALLSLGGLLLRRRK